MSEPAYQTDGASPQPPNATPAKGRNQQRNPSAAQGQGRRNQRSRKQNASMPNGQPLDGTVSDSVTNTTTSPRSKQAPRPGQNANMGAIPIHNVHAGQFSGHRGRPVSQSGHMLPATPAKEQAYAGPTFTASPAPSSLPVPKFFSRSVPNVAATSSLQARMEGDKTPEKEESSPETDAVSPAPAHRDLTQSPLDVFFNADRAEREKRRSGSGAFSPETANRAPATEPRNPFQPKSIFLRELAEGDEDMPSPRTVPQNNRPSPGGRAVSSPGHVPQVVADQQREASTQALKNLLFSNMNMAPANSSTASNNVTPPSAQQHSQPTQQHPYQGPQTPSPFHHSQSGPTTPGSAPAPTTEQQNNYHYGNRNLSPMFKAVRGETPTRPSGLRQEFAGDEARFNGYQQQSAFPPPPQSPPYQRFPPPGMPQQRHDPNAFSRNYLESQIRSSAPAQPPPGLISNGVNQHPASFSGPVPYAQYHQQYPQQHQQQQRRPVSGGSFPNPAAPVGNEGQSRDIKDMEDKLRNVLKLGV